MDARKIKVELTKWGNYAFIFPPSCTSYGEALRENLPRVVLRKTQSGWNGTAFACGECTSTFSAESYEEAREKAVGMVKKALEEKKS